MFLSDGVISMSLRNAPQAPMSLRAINNSAFIGLAQENMKALAEIRSLPGLRAYLVQQLPLYGHA
jgi:hypothetical protein